MFQRCAKLPEDVGMKFDPPIDDFGLILYFADSIIDYRAEVESRADIEAADPETETNQGPKPQ